MILFENISVELETLSSGYVAVAKCGDAVVTSFAHYDQQTTIDNLFANLAAVAVKNATEGRMFRSSTDE